MTILRSVAPILLCAASIASAQDSCKEFGLAGAGGPSGYTWRANRCEGVFVQEVAGSADLRLVSFVAGLEGSNLASVPALHVSWTLPSATDFRLRATSLRTRHYYRMDTRRAAGQGNSFDWPTDVLRAENLKPEEVGVVGWVKAPNFKEDVYIPLRIATAANFKPVVLTAAELSELYISLAKLGPDGKMVQQIKKEEPLGRGYYPASRGIAIPLPPLAAGFYQLEAAGVLKNGGSVTKAFLFYQPAK